MHVAQGVIDFFFEGLVRRVRPNSVVPVRGGLEIRSPCGHPLASLNSDRTTLVTEIHVETPPHDELEEQEWRRQAVSLVQRVSIEWDQAGFSCSTNPRRVEFEDEDDGTVHPVLFVFHAVRNIEGLADVLRALDEIRRLPNLLQEDVPF